MRVVNLQTTRIRQAPCRAIFGRPAGLEFRLSTCLVNRNDNQRGEMNNAG
jgi:hypothetical protein